MVLTFLDFLVSKMAQMEKICNAVFELLQLEVLYVGHQHGSR